MNRFALWIALLPLTAVLAACGGDSVGAVGAVPAAWTTTKAGCAGAYHYSTTSYGPLGVPMYKTTVAIANDQPAARAVERWENGAVTDQWVETGAQIGTHAEGAPALTMEQLYDDCRTKILSGASGSYDVVFETAASGALTQCTAMRAKDCVDDCSAGVVVMDFACGGPPTPAP